MKGIPKVFVIGDSYAYGQGVLQHEAWPALLTDELDVLSVARSWATTRGVRRQLRHPALAAADVVAVQVGGNDAGFVPALVRAFAGPPRPFTRPDVYDKLTVLLMPRLVRLYTEILFASDALIVPVGYPHLFPTEAPQQRSGTLRLFPPPNQAVLNYAAEAMDQAIDEVAAAVNPLSIRPVSVLDAFRGHAAHTAEPYVNPLMASLGSFHPNSRGHRCYAKVVAEHIQHELSNR